ncbi:MAG: anaerobic ribonucleoside-triphosphate reductase activating protein [Elusimicrobia bacterium RIFOXYD2_FULL_34_15]|nr:MAG: anaerobic ribonucleoside-triphosphate reductase activating protein [Elusimicrobia bacterium RIFOXYD2_FULL_34_15]
MFVADYLETSLLDWEGKISCVLFLSGCNFRCPWCQNKELALGKAENKISVTDIINKFKNKKSWIDGFVITGGEPTINAGLKNIISEIKNNGFSVKIDTNGSRPDVIKDIVSSGMVDFISMDIKTSLDKTKYDIACGVSVDLSAINKTVDILLNINPYVGVSFRTTVVPGITDVEDVKEIIKKIKNKKYSIQKFIPRNTLDEKYSGIEPYTEAEIKEMKEFEGKENINRLVTL